MFMAVISYVRTLLDHTFVTVALHTGYLMMAGLAQISTNAQRIVMVALSCAQTQLEITPVLANLVIV